MMVIKKTYFLDLNIRIFLEDLKKVNNTSNYSFVVVLNWAISLVPYEGQFLLKMTSGEGTPYWLLQSFLLSP